VRRLGAGLALLLCLLALFGCGSGDSETSSTAGTESTTSAPAAPKPEIAIETSSPGFDATRVYEEAAPGVVTIRSVFDP